MVISGTWTSFIAMKCFIFTIYEVELLDISITISKSLMKPSIALPGVNESCPFSVFDVSSQFYFCM